MDVEHFDASLLTLIVLTLQRLTVSPDRYRTEKGDISPSDSPTNPPAEGSSSQPKVFQLSEETLARLLELRAGTLAAGGPSETHVCQDRIGTSSSSFNEEIMDIIRPVINVAKEGEIKERLENAVSLLSARNELLVVADGDVSVFAFYDQQKKAETTKDPILVEFLKKKRKRKQRRNRHENRTISGLSHLLSTCPREHEVTPKWSSKALLTDLEWNFVLQAEGPQVRTCAISADDQIQSLLGSNAISVCTNTQGIRINPLSVAEGKKLRLILDLSDLNKYLEKVHIKFEDLSKVRDVS
ncbi:hypothetical protein COOONC_16897 [Cooperia oncophora]